MVTRHYDFGAFRVLIDRACATLHFGNDHCIVLTRSQCVQILTDSRKLDQKITIRVNR